MRGRRLSVISILLSALGTAHAQDPSTLQPSPPWPVQLGVRVATAQAGRPVAPIVVLVPDEATFLQEVGRWSMSAQWPVLFDDEELAPLFIRAFKPVHVFRVSPAQPLPTNRKDREDAMMRVVAQSWGGDETATPAEAFEAMNWKPPGVAVTDARDSAWPAAVALAAARGLSLAFLDGDYGQAGVVLGARRTKELKARLTRLIEQQGYSWRALGDTIDAVAICRSLAGRTSLEPMASARNIHADRHKGPYALTDTLCRHDNGARWAMAGWIWGSPGRSAYMAMSSIFLERSNIAFFNGYGTGGGRERYDVGDIAAQASTAGYTTKVDRGGDGDLDAWLNNNMGGLSVDVLVANSSGRPEEFNLAGGSKGSVVDVPLLARPLALHLIHSYSLQRPNDHDSVGGRFLDHGVYSYVGSVEEPYLGAFVPPDLLMRRLFSFVPFLVAGRSWDGPFASVWRLTTIGDPLMLVQPPGRRTIQVAEVPVIPNAINLKDLARDQLSELRASPAETGAVITTLVMLGRDDAAVQMWNRLGGEANLAAATEAAPVALQPLFRERDFTGFLRAFDRLPAQARRGDVLDMLWHLATARLGSITDPTTLGLLLASPRDPDPSIDLKRLLPHVERVLGKGAGRAAIERVLKMTRSEKVRTNLTQLLRDQN